MKISYNKKGGVISFNQEDWLAGLVPNYTNSISGGMNDARQITGSKGFTMMAGVDPFRHLGALSPGFSPSDVTNVSVVDSTIVAGVADGATAYLVGGTKNHTLTLSGTPTLTTPAPNTISHGAHSGVTAEDIIVYRANVSGTSTKCRFYSFYDNTDGEIGMETGGTYDNDFMSTVPSGAAASIVAGPIPLIIGADDCLYFGNGNQLGQFDGANGTNGTVVFNKLILPKEFTISCLVKLPNYLVIFASQQSNANSTYRGDSVAFFWDYASADPTYSYPIQTSYVTSAFNYGTTIGCFGSGVSTGIGLNNNKLFIFDGAKFNIKKTFPNSCPRRGGVEVIGETIYFATDGVSNLGTVGIGAIGSPYPEFSAGLNYIAVGAGNSQGLLRNFGGSTFYCSSGSTTSGGLQRFISGYEANARFSTVTATPDFPSGFKARLDRAKIKYFTISSGGRSLDLTMNFNRNRTNILLASGVSTITTSNLVQEKFYDAEVNTKPLKAYFFDSVSIYGVYTTGAGSSGIPPLIQSIDLYYTLSAI